MAEVETGEVRIVGASRSLRRLAEDRNDLVGMIAYSLFKFEQSEWAESAKPKRDEVDRHHVTLQEARIESLRSNAALKLSEWVEDLEAAWRADMYDQIRAEVIAEIVKEINLGVRREIEPLGARIDALGLDVSRSNDFWRAVWTNMVAWLLSLMVSALIIVLYLLPGLKIVPAN
ncbi:hypothetical protein [Prosthecomicrobium sp. N25]|uniref:hypothetical protein n=1 Tax=Prosthecomicrobium sp. N25 TaxID=3129254 RepID=UPI0030770E24